MFNNSQRVLPKKCNRRITYDFFFLIRRSVTDEDKLLLLLLLPRINVGSPNFFFLWRSFFRYIVQWIFHEIKKKNNQIFDDQFLAYCIRTLIRYTTCYGGSHSVRKRKRSRKILKSNEYYIYIYIIKMSC